MSRTDVWMPIFIGDYMGDTMHLRTMEHGAYFLLLMAHWKHGPLPDDDRKLASIARMTLKAWLPIAPTLRAFFTPTDQGLVQKRLMKERDHAESLSQKRSISGSKGGKERASNALKNNEPDQANASPSTKQNPTPSPSPSQVEEESDGASSAPAPVVDLEQARPIAPVLVAAEVVQIIARFDAARSEAFLDAAPRFPAQNDRIDAGRWLAAGVKAGLAPSEVVSLCADVFSAVHARVAARPNARPPRSLAFHDQDMADALKRLSQPLPPGQVATTRAGPSRPITAAERIRQLDAMG